MNDIPEFPGPEQIQAVGDPPAADAGQSRATFDDSDTDLIYANMIRLHSSPEEFAVDLAYVPNPALLSQGTIQVTQQVVLSPYNAKRLLSMLAQGVKRYEDQFGAIELDVRKRSQT